MVAYDSPFASEPIQAHPWGPITKIMKWTNQGPRGPSIKRATSNSVKIKKILELQSLLRFFHELSNIEGNLLNLFNKLSDIQYINNGIVNVSSYKLTNYEIAVLLKGLSFCPTSGAPDIGDIMQDLDTFKRRVRLQLFLSESN